MKLKFYAGLSVYYEDNPNAHITTAFSPIVGNPNTGTSPVSSDATIIGLDYWENADVTVALVDCHLAVKYHNKYRKQGFTWDFTDYKPHVTLSKGNRVGEFQHLLGTILPVYQEYRRIVVDE